MVVTFRCGKDAFIMVGKFHEVDTITLAVVGVYFFTTLQVEETYREVVTACYEVLAIV